MNKVERSPIRLLHTSDLHIGSDVYADDALKGLEAVLSCDDEIDSDAMVIAGDLFDNHRVSEAIVNRVFDDLGAFKKPVVVLPGNHDTLLTTKWTSRILPDNLKLIRRRNGELIILRDLNLAVWGRPVYDHHPSNKPMEGLPERPEDKWYVLLAHGLFMAGEVDIFRSSPITASEISNADCDYVALGHVHVFRNVSQNGVAAYYSGAPSGPQDRTVAIVDMGQDKRVNVTPVNLRK